MVRNILNELTARGVRHLIISALFFVVYALCQDYFPTARIVNERGGKEGLVLLFVLRRMRRLNRALIGKRRLYSLTLQGDALTDGRR